MAKNIAVFGIYRNRSQVEQAVEALKYADFRNADISVLFSENTGTKDFAVEKETKMPEGSTAGAGTGAVIGGTLGWLAGIGSLAIPGVGPLIAAGPIVSLLAGIGAGGVVGGIAGALVGMGIPEYEAQRYEGRVKDGGILLSVHCDNRDWKKQAMDILKRTGAEDIGSKGESDSDEDVSDKPRPKGSF
ncbi:general stress protein [Geomonas sp. RF6]|uniref:quinol:electron acceptor oxidoreductase subunit ActD n=1 Tax=Geomonas sp. RF6 TaxID=2897342 RepID=UPI001E423AEF|nr:quinol:electron acceptor oxidoreductase subunit ActD [Geomonas sp. RF6]UFS71477.1 general stress protein [Geomonas sp. RF6]